MVDTTVEDADAGNLAVRAGYLMGIVMRGEGTRISKDDIEFLVKAARSLSLYASLQGSSPPLKVHASTEEYEAAGDLRFGPPDEYNREDDKVNR